MWVFDFSIAQISMFLGPHTRPWIIKNPNVALNDNKQWLSAISPRVISLAFGRRRFARQDISPPRHFTAETFYRRGISPPGYFTACHLWLGNLMCKISNSEMSQRWNVSAVKCLGGERSRRWNVLAVKGLGGEMTSGQVSWCWNVLSADRRRSIVRRWNDSRWNDLESKIQTFNSFSCSHVWKKNTFNLCSS